MPFNNTTIYYNKSFHAYFCISGNVLIETKDKKLMYGYDMIKIY